MGEGGVARGLPRAALLAALLAAVAAGCGRSAKHEGAPARDSAAARRDSASAYRNPAEAPEPRPARPAGPPIGRGDPLMNSIRPALVEWVAMWRAAIPGFETDSLWRGKSERWTPEWRALPKRPAGERERVPFEEQASAQVFTVTSPGSAFDLEIDTYQMIGDDGSIGGEPDSRSALYDRARNRETVLVFSGTMGGQHWGRWLDAHHFVLAGWHDETDSGHWKSGWISVYSLPDSSLASYTTLAVPETAFDRYRGAWEEWVLRRYRALKTPV